MREEEFVSPMTEVTQQAFDAAAAAGLSAFDAARALTGEVQIRSFADMLGRFAPPQGLRAALVDGLCANDAGRSRASIDKKVRGWLGGKYQPTAREDLLELCFVLRLGVQDADAFLAAAGEAGLHWRDPRELVYAFALRRGMDYPQAQALLQRVMPPESAFGGEEQSFTPLVRSEAAALNTEEELAQYLREAAPRLSAMHNSAYRQFEELLRVLEQPQGSSGCEEARYSAREVVERYLDKHLPSAREGKGLSEVHRAILAGWPDEIMLSRMRNRRLDVTRKVLVLLFLATDGGDVQADGDDEDGWDEDEWDAEADPQEEADAAFRSSVMRLNQMLAACGYRMLDARNPFDWVALYCMRVEDDTQSWDGLNERLSHVLDVLFAAAPEPGK